MSGDDDRDQFSWSRLAARHEFLRRLAETIDGGSLHGGINRLVLTGSAEVRALPISDLLELRREGHTVVLAVIEDDWSLDLRAEGPSDPTMESSGPLEQAVGERDV